MNVSREYMIRELETVGKDIKSWVRELKEPGIVGPDGKIVPAYGESGPPAGLSVSEVQNLNVEQLRAELAAMSAKLASLAET